MSERTPEQQAAWDKLYEACQAWAAVAPKQEPRKDAPTIQPMKLHSDPGNFYRGYNMMLDAGGNVPGKIPVIVLPIRPQDIARYKSKQTVQKLLRYLEVIY